MIFPTPFQFYRDFFNNLHGTNPVTATASVTCIFVLILIKEGINNNPTCKKDLPVPVPIELIVVSMKEDNLPGIKVEIFWSVSLYLSAIMLLCC